MPTGGTLPHLNIKQNHPALRCLQVTASTRALALKGKGGKGNKGAPRDNSAISGRLEQDGVPRMAEKAAAQKDNAAACSSTN